MFRSFQSPRRLRRGFFVPFFSFRKSTKSNTSFCFSGGNSRSFSSTCCSMVMGKPLRRSRFIIRQMEPTPDHLGRDSEYLETLARLEPSQSLCLVPGANERNCPRPLRLCRPHRCWRGHYEPPPRDAHGFSLQPSSLLAASTIQLLPCAQLVRLYRSFRVSSASSNFAAEQRPAFSLSGPRLPRPFPQPASGKHHRRHRSLPPRFRGRHFFSAASPGTAALEVLPLQHLFRLCRSFLS